jgi:radical SAM protein with 4Fe4S-binding SPASM domain
MKPLHAWINLTSQCNNACAHCYYAHSMTWRQMSWEQAIGVLRLVKSLAVTDCTLIGGEPTLYPGLAAIVNAALSFGLSVNLVTNGRVMCDRDYCRELLSARPSGITLSLEGPTAQVHDEIVGCPGAFDELISAVENLISLGYKPGIITTICRANSQQLDGIVALLRRYSFQKCVFNLCTPSIDSRWRHNQTVAPQELARLIWEIGDRHRDLRISIVTPLPKCLLPQAVPPNVRIGLCQMFHGTGFCVDVDGSILPCTHFSRARLFSIFDDTSGAVNDDPQYFMESWEKAGGTFRDNLWVYPTQECSGCRTWSSCLCGCPLFWTEFDPQSIGLQRVAC